MASSGVPFMAPLVCDHFLNIPVGGGTWRCFPPGCLELITSLRSKVFLPPQSLALRIMVERCLILSASLTDYGNCGKCRRGSGSGGPKKDVAEAHRGG